MTSSYMSTGTRYVRDSPYIIPVMLCIAGAPKKLKTLC